MTAQAADLTVVTFNTESDGDTSPSLVAQQIRELGALGRFPIKWNHLVDKEPPQIQYLERFRAVRHDSIPTESALAGC